MNDDDYTTGESIIDAWFSSDAWKTIMHDANQGDKDSEELVDRINEQLMSLIFHIQNGSNQNRLEYELKLFYQLCVDFDVPTWN